MTGRDKRILIVTPPGYGHFFPIVPLAWALRASGNEVLVASCGVSLPLSTRAGLASMNAAPGIDLQAIFRRFRDDYQSLFFDPDLKETGENSHGQLKETVFTVLGNAMLDGVARAVDAWRPDVIVYTPYAAAAPIIASKHQIPAVFLGIALAYVPQAMFDGTYSRMAAACARHNVASIDTPAFWIDTAPQSLRKAPLDGLLMRPVTYNGAELIDGAALGPRSRAQVAVTLGTVVPLTEGLRPLRWLVGAACEVAVDFVIGSGTTNATDLGTLPPNVRIMNWIGFDSLFSESIAVIHHGGPSTMFAALHAGLPQLVIPRGSDQFYNAEALRRRGVALVPDERDLSAAAIKTLLTDNGLRTAAEDVSKEIRDMPTPAEVAPRVVELCD